MPALTVGHVKNNTIPDWSGQVTVGNSTGGTTTMQASDMVRPSDWNSDHNWTFTLSASDIGSFFSAGNGLGVTTNSNGVTFSHAPAPNQEPFPFPNSNSITITYAQYAWVLDPFP